MLFSSFYYRYFLANFRRHGSSCYHRPCDSIDVYVTEDNMNFLGKTTDSIAKSLDKLSEPQEIHPTSTARTLTTASTSMLKTIRISII